MRVENLKGRDHLVDGRIMLKIDLDYGLASS
jgi:hypothetical protein